MIQKFELSLTSNYAHNWSIQDALRELVQNAIDQQTQVEDNEMNIYYNKYDSTLVISNKNSILKKKSLLLGYSSKQDDSSTIGQFGEGYKISLLVLLREGKSITINNYGAKEIWTPKLVKSRRYEGERVLTIQVNNKAIWSKVPHYNLELVIGNITYEEYQELVNRTLQLQTINPNNVISLSQGEILTSKEHKGKIFVNGLYISTIDVFDYGYSIKPKYITIGRDRNLIDSFDIQYLTSRMWEESCRDDLLMPLIIKGKPEVSYLVTDITRPHSLTNLADKAYSDFKTKYGSNAIPVKSSDDMLSLKSMIRNINPIVIDKVHYNLITLSPLYQSNNYINDENSLTNDYQKWKLKYKGSVLTSSSIQELDDIVTDLLKNNGGLSNENNFKEA